MCRDQARKGCRSRAITQGRRVTVMRGHCHPPDLGGLEALRQRDQLPTPAQREGSGAGEGGGRGLGLVSLGTAQSADWREPGGTVLLWPRGVGLSPWVVSPRGERPYTPALVLGFFPLP